MEEWKEYKLGEITVMKNGKKRPQKEGLYPVYGGNGVMDYSNNYNSEKVVIVGRVGAYCGCVYKCDEKCWVSDNAIAVSPKDIVDFHFLYYLMSTLDFHYHHIGGAQPLMTQDIIGDFNIKLPSTKVQQQIVSILKSLDDKIELNRRINDNLEQQAQALFKSWFVDFEPFKDGEFVESELGMIPKGWRVETIGNICNKITDGVHNTVKDDDKGDFYLLSCKNIKGGVITIGDNERKINQETFNKLRKRTQLNKGDILLSSVGTIGEMVLLFESPSNIEFQRSVAMIKPDKEKVSSEFLFFSLRNQKEKIIHCAHGAVQQCLFISDIANFITIYPPKLLIERFTKMVVSFVEETNKKQCECHRLIQLRDSLLPRLMSGELKPSDIPL